MQRVIDVTEWTRKFEKIANRKIEQYKQQNSDAPKMAAFFNVTDMRAMERYLEEIKKCIPFLEVCLLSHIGFLLIRNGLNISMKAKNKFLFI